MTQTESLETQSGRSRETQDVRRHNPRADVFAVESNRGFSAVNWFPEVVHPEHEGRSDERDDYYHDSISPKDPQIVLR